VPGRPTSTPAGTHYFSPTDADNVETLNRVARDLWERSGRLTGPELTPPGGRTYRAGDRVITLAPGPHGAWATSQAARVTAVDPEAQTLIAITPDGRQLQMGLDDIAADRLAYGYAITAHRAQGTTVEVAHVLDDGGGRELAYVAMSRARKASHVYTTAPDLAEAAQRLTWSWMTSADSNGPLTRPELPSAWSSCVRRTSNSSR